MIVVIDYGVGNLFSLLSSLKFLGIEAKVSRDIEDIQKAEKIILPGVGAFGDAIKKLEDTGLIPVIKSEVEKGKPILGICLGMQLLFDYSKEYGISEGLGLIKGGIVSISELLEEKKISLKIPHIGWNKLNIKKSTSPIVKYCKDDDYVYYVHSFCGYDCEESTVAVSEYGIDIVGIVQKENIFGCQFHPEKSGKVGLSILKAFSEL